MNGSRETERPAAIILCGGLSSRMGQSKALLPWGDKTLIEVLVDKVRGHVGPIVLVAGLGQALPLIQGVELLTDQNPFPGPLTAFRQGLSFIPRATLCVLLSCDLPLFEPALIELFLGAIGEADAAIPLVKGIHQPLCALYRIKPVLDALKNLPQVGGSMGQLRGHLKAVELNENPLRLVDSQLDSFHECNTAEEYRNLARGLKI